MTLLEALQNSVELLKKMNNTEFLEMLDSLDPKEIERWKMPEETLCMRGRIDELEKENARLRAGLQIIADCDCACMTGTCVICHARSVLEESK